MRKHTAADAIDDHQFPDALKIAEQIWDEVEKISNETFPGRPYMMMSYAMAFASVRRHLSRGNDPLTTISDLTMMIVLVDETMKS